MKVKYKSPRRYGQTIDAVEIVRETDKCVFIARIRGEPSRVAKTNDYHIYCDTWEEAHRLLLKRAENELSYARAALQRAQSFHANVKGMRAPEVRPASAPAPVTDASNHA